MSQLIDGITIRKIIQKQLTDQIIQHQSAFASAFSTHIVPPQVVILQIGDNQESNTYIKHKMRFADEIGVRAVHKKFDCMVGEQEVVNEIIALNNNNEVHGIVVQLPIPQHISTSRILEQIVSEKDIDGLTSASVNSLLHNEFGYISGATQAVLKIVQHLNIDCVGKKVVIVGHSALVGKPTALALMNQSATVTVCHEFTKKLAHETKLADILITAVGKPMLITKDHVREGQIVIDIGITINEQGKVVGDVHYEQVKDIVGYITPVPGGVGPITIACLFENLIHSYINKKEAK